MWQIVLKTAAMADILFHQYDASSKFRNQPVFTVMLHGVLVVKGAVTTFATGGVYVNVFVELLSSFIYKRWSH